MKHIKIILFIVLIIGIFTPGCFFVSENQTNSFLVKGTLNNTAKTPVKTGAYLTGEYPNLFKELLNEDDLTINKKIQGVFEQLFYGDDDTQRIYYPVLTDMAYIKDINNNDVRTEGMSYGMMIAVQLNKKDEFDRLWKWAKTYMQNKTGQHKDYFAWHCTVDGTVIDTNSASDGEEWFVMSLFFASARWGDGNGIYNYKNEAQIILNAMLSKTEMSDAKNVVTNIFNRKEKQVVFVPTGEADDFTDPSYHLPHFYKLWAKFSDKENKFWSDVSDTSYSLLKKAVNQITGLFPDYSKFDGTPFDFWGSGHSNFQYDAWRVAANISIDYTWFAGLNHDWDEWVIQQSNRYLNFFYKQGIGKYGGVYTLEGKLLINDHSLGLIATNAVACLSSTNNFRKDFVEELWSAQIPEGKYRYYDGILYLLGLLQVSGNFQIYNLSFN